MKVNERHNSRTAKIVRESVILVQNGERTKFRRLSVHRCLSAKVGVSFNIVGGGMSITPIDIESNNKAMAKLFSTVSSERLVDVIKTTQKNTRKDEKKGVFFSSKAL